MGQWVAKRRIRLPTSQAERKIEGGKLVHVSIRHEDDLIRSITVTGDFFIHPEEDLQKLEEAAKGLPLNRPDQIAEVLNRAIRENGTRIIGFSVEDLVHLICEDR